MHFFRVTKAFVYVPVIVFALLIARFAYLEVSEPGGSGVLWLVPLFGFFWCCGTVVWYSIERDKDKAWHKRADEFGAGKCPGIAALKNAKLKIDSLNDLLETEEVVDEHDVPKIEPARQDDRIEIVRETPEFPVPDGFDIPWWCPPGEIVWYLAVWAPLVRLSEGIGEADGSIYWLLVTTVALIVVAVFVIRCLSKLSFYRAASFQEAPGRPDYQETGFYRFIVLQAQKLGLEEMGDYRESGFRRTIFATKARDCIVQIGIQRWMMGVVIETLTDNGVRQQSKSLVTTKPSSNTKITAIKCEFLTTALAEHAGRLAATVGEDGLKVIPWSEETLEFAHNHRRFRQAYQTPVAVTPAGAPA